MLPGPQADASLAQNRSGPGGDFEKEDVALESRPC
jgi:hypothetical protein